MLRDSSTHGCDSKDPGFFGASYQLAIERLGAAHIGPRTIAGGDACATKRDALL